MHRRRAKYFIEIIIHALFWLGVYYALNALTATSYSMVIEHGNEAMQRIDVRMLFPYSGMVLGSLMLLFYGNTFWLFKKAIRYKSDFRRVAAITGWFTLLFGMNYLLIHTLVSSSGNSRYIRSTALLRTRADKALPGSPRTKVFFESRSDTALVGPTPKLPSPPPFFGESTSDSWLHMQPVIAVVFLSILAIAAAHFFIKEWIRNDLTRSQVEAHQLSTEIKFLRSQVNPHFLFNTLNNLFSMAQKRGNDELADGISKLSGMMRYMLYESNTDSVSLQKEITYLEDCIALNKLRYADSEVAVCFSYPALAITSVISVAPMLFVPFLENAFKHGVSIGHHSSITVAISVNRKQLIFTCENTDHSAVKKLAEEKVGIGLENVSRRLELVYPGRYKLQAGPEEGKYAVNLQIELA